MKTIAPDQLHQLPKVQPNLPLLDVRTPVEYAESLLLSKLPRNTRKPA